MTTALAVTGHMDLTEAAVPAVRAALRALVGRQAPVGLVGISCLAEGADALFAEEVLAAGGRLIAVVPSRDYRDTQVTPEHAGTFDRLLTAAAEVIAMPAPRADRAAYEAANGELLARADRLVAVWDGSPPSGRGGGTADTVAQARAAGIAVDVVWPHGAARGA
ncbi:hypothetical protein [Streptomyces sp. NPDC053427]|uniref:hypothetical protein n=1 Tax=Streptomyces sp. NPDC053427 TaxID=3365701 RepID=UPI0037D05610